jgi:hypothetical protein
MASFLNAFFSRGSQVSPQDTAQSNPEASIEEIVAETEAVTITGGGSVVREPEAMEVDPTASTAPGSLLQRNNIQGSNYAPKAINHSLGERRPRASSNPVGKEQDAFKQRFGYVYDARMMAHMPVADDLDHPEAPGRIAGIYQKLREGGCLFRMKLIPIRPVKMMEAMLVHSEDHWEKVMQIACKLFEV